MRGEEDEIDEDTNQRILKGLEEIVRGEMISPEELEKKLGFI
jgi:hypothetical protein